MKHLSFLLLLLFFFCTATKAQTLPGNFNLVPNPSFEFNFDSYWLGTVSADTSLDGDPICWIRANKTGLVLSYDSSGTSTYATHYLAHTGNGSAVEVNTIGNGYLITSGEWLDSEFQMRTYHQTRLLQPLVAGTTYYFSLYAGVYKRSITTAPLSDALGNIGVYFSIEQLHDYSNLGRINVTPQIRFTSWDTAAIYDSMLYTKLSVTYTATGGEQYMTIGDFDFVAQQNYIYISPYSAAGGQTASITYYPIIDDVSLVSDTTLPMISLAYFSLGRDTILCPGTTITIGGEPNFFHYLWNTGDTSRFITVDTPGVYWCNVDYGCNTYTDTIHVLPAPHPPSFNLTDTSLCAVAAYTVHIPTGYAQYIWSTGVIGADSITIDSAGTYWVSVIAACGIHYADTFSVTGINATIIPFTIPDKYLCTGNDTIKAPAGYASYLWSTGDTTTSTIIDRLGIYSITVSNTCNIHFTDTFHVHSVIDSINLGNDTLICNGNFTDELSIPAALTNILWSTGDSTPAITVTNTGSYFVTAQSICGTFSDTINVTFCAPLIDSMSISADTICSGQCLTFSATLQNYPQTETWTFTGGSPSSYIGADPPSVCYAAAGTDMVKLVVTSRGGTDSMIKEVVVLPAPRGSFADTVITVPYKSFIELQPCVPAQHTMWYHNDTLVCDTCTLLTADAVDYHSTYTCVVSNAGCTDTCTYTVWVSGIPTDVWLPTAFTPNGDGKNDYFHIITDNPNIQVLTFSVYNRYGQEIYNVANNSQGWDGTFNGNHIDTDVYFWYLRYKVYGNDTIFFKKGDVTLIR